MSYQVSVACEAMVRDGIIDASADPGLVRVRETTAQQYIPEVFYKV
jgi:nuclear protein localization family protein 4